MQHHFNVEIAREFGILEAVLLENINFWIAKNAANEKNYYDGDYWTYNSYKAFAELFPYATERQIKYALKKLKDEGIIKTGNYNQNSYDRTLWYALTEKGKSIVKNETIDRTNLSNGKVTSVQPIPYNKPYNKPNDKERKKEKTFDDIFAEKEVSDELKNVFVEFIKSRKLNGKKMTNRALELAIDKVRRMARLEEEQIAIINQSIENGWQGLFPLKERPLELPELGDEYEPIAGEDMTWRRILDFWEEAMEYRPGESKDNVRAIKKLLELDGEDGVRSLIASLRMRSEYKYLSSAIKNVSSPQDLLEHRQDIWSFYNKNKDEWHLWSEKAKEGKNRWEL